MTPGSGVTSRVRGQQPDALEVDADEAAELDRRLAEYRANPTAGLSWDEVKAQILSRR